RHFLDLHASTGKVFDGKESAFAHPLGQFEAGALLETQQAVDVKVALVVEGADVAVGGSEDAGNAAARYHRPVQAGGHQIHLGPLCHRQTEFGILHARLEQRDDLAGRSVHRLDIQLLFNDVERLTRIVDDADVVLVGTQQFSDRGTDRP